MSACTYATQMGIITSGLFAKSTRKRIALVTHKNSDQSDVRTSATDGKAASHAAPAEGHTRRDSFLNIVPVGLEKAPDKALDAPAALDAAVSGSGETDMEKVRGTYAATVIPALRKDSTCFMTCTLSGLISTHFACCVRCVLQRLSRLEGKLDALLNVLQPSQGSLGAVIKVHAVLDEGQPAQLGAIVDKM